MLALPANFAWSDHDGRTLYRSARTGLYRLRLSAPEVMPPLNRPAMETR
jgi:hypothetical protein